MNAEKICYSCLYSKKERGSYKISDSQLDEVEKILNEKGYYIKFISKGSSGGYRRYLFMDGEAVLSDVDACFVWGLELAAKTKKSLEKMAKALGTPFPKKRKE